MTRALVDVLVSWLIFAAALVFCSGVIWLVVELVVEQWTEHRKDREAISPELLREIRASHRGIVARRLGLHTTEAP